MLRTLAPIAVALTLAAPACAEDSVEEAIMDFEDDLREFKVQRAARSKRAAAFEAEAVAAAPAQAAKLWEQASLELKGVFELTLGLRDSFLRLQSVLDSQPPFFYPDIREQVVSTAALVDSTVAYGVAAVVRLELRSAARTGAGPRAAMDFLGAHAHLLTSAQRAEPEAAIAEALQQQAKAEQAAVDSRRWHWNAARERAELRTLGALETAVSYAEQATAGQGPGAERAAAQFARELYGRPLLRVDLAPEIGAGWGGGLHGRVVSGRFNIGAGLLTVRIDGAWASGVEGRVGLDLVGAPPWQMRRSAAVPTLSWSTVSGPGFGLEFSRYRRRYNRGVRHFGVAADVLPTAGTGRIRLFFGRAGAV